MVDKAVLVTGCSSGIGKTTAVYLSQKNFLVFAGVRRRESVEDLQKMGISNLLPLYPLDLTKPEDINRAFEFISEELRKYGIPGLYGLVNNAGGGFIAPIELMDVEDLKIEFETRIVGPIRLLQLFLPLIRKGNGRILWVVTPALIPVPFVASIHIYDFAVNCLARTLNLELKKWGVPVIQIRCGGIKTPGVEKSYKKLEQLLASLPKEKIALYEDEIKQNVDRLKGFDRNRTEPIEVAKVIYHALRVKNPKARYRVGYMSGFSSMIEFLPQSVVDLIMRKMY